MSDVAIKVEGISKQYKIGGVKRQTYQTLQSTIMEAVKGPFRRAKKLMSGDATGAAELDEIFWALQDVSFEIKKGEVVGILGRNGAGKSTLLKILSRITDPTKGYADIRGRVASLLEVGAGFSLELTGRENTYLNGAILGMTKAEIDRKFDEIVDFAEVEKFIDTPVKHYSNGLYLRLAFSVAAHLEPEILMVDEVLAVGDAKFQKKCMGKLDDVAKGGRTVLFVSHNMAAMEALCSRGILLRDGRVVADTTGAEAVKEYSADFGDLIAQPLWQRTDRRGDGVAKLTEFWVENAQGDRTSKAIVGQDMRLCFAFEAKGPLRNFQLGINFQETLGSAICSCFSSDVGYEFDIDQERGVVVCEIKRFPMRAGRYVGDVYARVRHQTSDWIKGAFVLDVEDADFYGTGRLMDLGYGIGKVLVSHDWEIRKVTDNRLNGAIAS